MLSMLVTFDTSHSEMSPLNDVARMNMRVMSVTLDTSHFEMSALNDHLSENMRLMSVTPETSHSPIGPCGPLEQSPSGESSIQELTAPLSSLLEFGENAAARWGQSSGTEL